MRIRITSPCTEDWSAMRDAPGGRHCAACDRDVLDLRELPRERAESLVVAARASGHPACIRMRVDRTGAPVFADAALAVLRRAAGGAALAATLASCGPATDTTEPAAAPIEAPHLSAETPAPAPVVAEPAPAAPVVEAPPVEPPAVPAEPTPEPRVERRWHAGHGHHHRVVDDDEIMGLSEL